MKLLSKSVFPIIFFILLHVFLLNINAAEWGDTYRILRGAEHIKELTYPDDEKRPPLFSAILATRPFEVDPILYGRVVMFVLSVASFFVFAKLLDLLIPTYPNEVKNVALLLFTLNPVFLYWSLRIYADVLFALFVLINILLITKWKDKLASFQPLKVIALAFISALAVFTRFEGYLLFGSIGFGLLFINKDAFNIDKNILRSLYDSIKSNLKNIIVYTISFIALLTPYFIWRNPLSSSYFQETAGRTYDLNTLLIFTISLIFSFGFVYALFFLVKNKGENYYFLKSHPAIFMFLASELILILLWPAAIPRLFVPILPFLIVLLAMSIYAYFENKDTSTSLTKKISIVLSLGLLLSTYIVGQYFYKLQFLVVQLEVFVFIVVVNLILSLTILFKFKRIFYITLVVCMFAWSLAAIYVHKDIHKGIVQVTELASREFCGKFAYNDVSSVSNWYLNSSPHAVCTEGYYYDITENKSSSKEDLSEKNADFVLVTNEHNTDMEIDFDDTPHIVELLNVQYEINGKIFFTNLYKFEKDL